MKQRYWTIAAMTVGLGLAAGPAGAQNLICISTVAPAAPVTYDNVSVPANATCTLNALSATITVTGNVIVAAGAELIIKGGATVDGSVTANGAVLVAIVSGNLTGIPSPTIDGNVTVVGNAGIGGIDIDYATIAGHVTISGTTGGPIFVGNSMIGNNLMVSGNTTAGTAPNDVIENNMIGGNFLCPGNTPYPTNVFTGTAYPNTVTGNNQCGI
jgi:hypothetical protein